MYKKFKQDTASKIDFIFARINVNIFFIIYNFSLNCFILSKEYG